MPQTIVLGITERKPIGVFCSSESLDSGCFLVDNNGIVFEPLTILPQDVTIVRQAINDKQVFTGENVVAQNMMDAIYKIQKSLKDNFQINLLEALISTPVRLDIKTGENWQIYFDLDARANIDSQIEKLNLLLNSDHLATSRKNLKYIDLRPKDRAVVCDNSTCGK